MKTWSKIMLTVAGGLCLAINTTILAQAPDEESAGPVDIQADQQQFAGDTVIANGRVRVVYKDSIILAPQVVLTKDGGSPQKAVFTGHPHLTQKDSVLDAETLTFDIAGKKIFAKGHAHSEVISSGGSDTPPASVEQPVDTNGTLAPKNVKLAKAVAPVEKIITDSDEQVYDQDSNQFLAAGHVHVINGDIRVVADKLQLLYGVDKKPETAIFNGHVSAQQGKNDTESDAMTYSLSTKNLQATGHVRSKVIQEKADNTSTQSPTHVANAGPGAAVAAPTMNKILDAGTDPNEDDEVIIVSDAQDFNKNTGRVQADGNVKLYYGEIIGSGPRVIINRNAGGKPQKIVFIGRSQLLQPGRKWIGDHITFMTESKHVLAQGNTKAFFVKDTGLPSEPAGGAASSTEPARNTTTVQAQLAGRPGTEQF